VLKHVNTINTDSTYATHMPERITATSLTAPSAPSNDRPLTDIHSQWSSLSLLHVTIQTVSIVTGFCHILPQ